MGPTRCSDIFRLIYIASVFEHCDMTSDEPIPQRPLWFRAIADVPEEFSPTRLTLLEGKLPSDLKGTLYYNGAARFSRGGASVNHWFDGDGAILAIHFEEEQAIGTYRFVQTQEFIEETKAETLLYGGFGTLPAVGLGDRLQKILKNTANTSVLVLADRILALWEGGKPYALTPDDLTTLGIDTLGFLEDKQTFSAHPKQDPVSGDIYNFGVGLGRREKLFVYRCDRQCQILKQVALPLKGIPIIHDFVLAGPYLVFCIAPVRLQHPFKILLGLQSYSDGMTWMPQNGTQVLILDRETLEVVSQDQVEPWFQWHFGNGFQNDQGNVVLTLARYEDFQTNQLQREVISGDIRTVAESSLWQCEIDPASTKIVSSQTLVGQMVEFPTVNALRVGVEAKTTYFSTHREHRDCPSLMKQIGWVDHATGTWKTSQLPPTHFPVEPIFAPNTRTPERGWVLTVVYDGDRHQSEVWIYEANNFDSPICRLGLPSVIPIGFHGTWRPNQSSPSVS